MRICLDWSWMVRLYAQALEQCHRDSISVENLASKRTEGLQKKEEICMLHHRVAPTPRNSEVNRVIILVCCCKSSTLAHLRLAQLIFFRKRRRCQRVNTIYTHTKKNHYNLMWANPQPSQWIRYKGINPKKVWIIIITNNSIDVNGNNLCMYVCMH